MNSAATGAQLGSTWIGPTAAPLSTAFIDIEPNRLESTFRETLYRHTGGNPLFTIELLLGLQERGDLVRDEAGRWVEGAALHWERLPPRVEAVIAERFGRLAPECRELLSVASVEGEEFTAEVLARVTGLPLSRVIDRLSETLSKQHQLVRPARLLYRGPGGQTLSRYRFSHGLSQLFIYNHLDEVIRVHLHRSVVEALEALRLQGEAEAKLEAHDPTAPLRLAWHWEASGMPLQAARALHDAGLQATQLIAYGEAATLYRRGLALLSGLPDSSERDGQELDLQLALGSALLTTDGMGSQGQIVAYSRAYELSQRLGERAALWPALHALASSSTARGQYQKALELGEQLLALAERSADSTVLALAHFTLGATLFSSGISLVARPRAPGAGNPVLRP